ncbi:MAG: DUF4250 domain-containing protein [Lachnospiraceae bacterium]|nr:DUF4250 domain-containing protein [Lachnospiraceae bacterium]
MNLPLDPVMLLSVVNMNLRDRYTTLSDFCKSNDVDEEDIKRRLATIDYYYVEEKNQFT